MIQAMKLQIDRISEGEKKFYAEEPATGYDIAYLDFGFKHPIGIDIVAQVVSKNLVVSGKIWTTIQMTCSRCLNTFSKSWTDPSYHFDCEVASPHEIIDLTENIREDIILDLPVKPLCREDCKGLCNACGSDLNKSTCECSKRKKDIRWAGLDEL